MEIDEKLESNKKIERVVGIFFPAALILAGLIMCIVCSIGYVNFTKRSANFIEITGKVIDIKEEENQDDFDGYSEERIYVIQYTVDDVDYQIESSSYRALRFKGSYIQVKYNPENPADAYVVEDTNDGLYLVLIGVFLVIAGATTCAIVLSKNKKIKDIEVTQEKLKVNSITCPYCGASNPLKSDKCDNCGANLRE